MNANQDSQQNYWKGANMSGIRLFSDTRLCDLPWGHQRLLSITPLPYTHAHY